MSINRKNNVETTLQQSQDKKKKRLAHTNVAKNCSPALASSHAIHSIPASKRSEAKLATRLDSWSPVSPELERLRRNVTKVSKGSHLQYLIGKPMDACGRAETDDHGGMRSMRFA
jgi:hypothetical protein